MRVLVSVLISSFLVGCSSNQNKVSLREEHVFLSGEGLITSAVYCKNEHTSTECMCLVQDENQASSDRFMIDPKSVDQFFGSYDPPLSSYQLILFCSYRAELTDTKSEPKVVCLNDLSIKRVEVILDGEYLSMKFEPPIKSNELRNILIKPLTK